MAIDMDARYSVAGYSGIAFYLTGYATDSQEITVPLCEHLEDGPHDDDCEYIIECEETLRDDMVIAVMVGDDREHTIDVDDLTRLDDDEYCSSCGQIGCGWD